MLKNILIGFQEEFKKEGSYLVPLRIFLGMGWLRAFSEKISDTGWTDGGEKLSMILNQKIESGLSFDFYIEFLNIFVIPNVDYWAFLIIIGQFLCGISLMLGIFTNIGLIAAIFMNFNFIFIGSVNPSVFYIIVQLILLLSNNGHIFGLDRWISNYFTHSYFIAHEDNTKFWKKDERIGYWIVATGLIILSIFSFPKIKSFDAHSVDDPAMILFILGLLCASCLIIGIIRLEPSHLRSNVEE
jgi:thiosulfate dehydrogenase [quinone] large subunit